MKLFHSQSKVPGYTREAYDTALLPRDPATGEPREPMQAPGYYPGFSTMAQRKFWDAATRDLITMRVEQPPPIRYFTVEQACFWRAVFDHLIPQHDRMADRRIPLVETLDERLYQNLTIGYRYEDMPQNREAYRLGQEAIDEEAKARFGGAFVHLPNRQQDEVLKAIHDSKPEAASAIWKSMPVGRFWMMLMQDALESYYSHPWSWDEIGFGGPAYPRAYTRLERGEPEPWEVEEHRYQWNAPSYAVSDVTESTAHLHTESSQNT
jgi:hypothetical protein